LRARRLSTALSAAWSVASLVALTVALSVTLTGCSTPPAPARDDAAGLIADGTYVGTLPCADCAGIRTELTLYRNRGGQPARFRLRETYLRTRDGDQVIDTLAAWTELDARVRLQPHDDPARRSLRRLGADTLELLDRDERPPASGLDYRLRRDATRAPLPLAQPPRRLFAGTLRRAGSGWMLTPCDGGAAQPARDLSVESTLSAVLADLGFNRRNAIHVEAFGREVDGVLHLERLNRAGTEMGCATGTLQWQAQGNEPFWSLRADDARLALLQPGAPEVAVPAVPLAWQWRDNRADRASARIDLRTEATALTVTLTPRLCRDTMADAVYGFSAEVSIRASGSATARRFTGCAYLGSAPLP
jgi:uncharacterized membrane protein/uncharacterized lipoprotein NlpE involved in copper resistance